MKKYLQKGIPVEEIAFYADLSAEEVLCRIRSLEIETANP
jgi:hypothetical protein